MPSRLTSMQTTLLVTYLVFLVSATDLYAEDVTIYRQTRLAPDDPSRVKLFGANVQVAGKTAVVAGIDISLTFVVFYVFHFEDGRWVEQARLELPDLPFDLTPSPSIVGAPIEASASRIVVGDPSWIDPDCFEGGATEGRVFVFERDGEGWSGPDGFERDGGGCADVASFGGPVDLSGERIAVGGRIRVGTDGHSGYAQVYVRNGDGWQLDQGFGCGPQGGLDGCAHDISFDGNVLLLGAAGGASHHVSDHQGTVYVYERTNEQWDTAVLISEGAAANPPEPCSYGGVVDHFGEAVAVSEGVLAILDPQSCAEFGNYQGIPIQTVMYEKSGNAWQSFATVPDVIPHELARNRMWVWNVAIDEQAIYTRDGSTWSQALVLDNLGPFESEDRFVSYDFDGGALIAGDPYNDISGDNVGSAVIYSLRRFDDVPYDHWAYDHIEALGANGITSGCGIGVFCPNQNVTRSMMAVFLERAVHGAANAPPPASGAIFSDVSSSDFAADYIEQLAADGITSGCGGGRFCPGMPVSRAQMAVFLLRAKYGPAYSPPAAAGDVFEDVDSTYWAAAWIEQLAAEGITNGCGAGKYCPEVPVSRAHMAAFLVRTFGL